MAVEVSDGKAVQLVKWLIENAIEGVPGLTSAENLAQEYLLDKGYVDNDARVDALIRWEDAKNFTSGFLTGLGGIITLPVAVPAALGAAWLIQARMAGAIARIYGNDLKSDRVRTLVLLSICGNSIKEIVKDAGIVVGRKTLEQVIKQVPGRVLIEINKKVGFRLVTRAGQKGVVNLIKVVPLAGGVVGGTVDAVMCHGVGKTAKHIFGQGGAI